MNKRILLSSAIVALLAMMASAHAQVQQTFTLDTSTWDQQPERINLAGDFNDWSPDATPMKQGEGNVWSVTVALKPGVHRYKFVADGERWLPDPKADPALDADDGNGGKNSGVRVPEAAQKPAKAAEATDGVTFSLDTSAWEQQPERLNLAGDFNNWSADATPMKQGEGNVWSVKLKLKPGVHHYKFVADGERWLTDPKADPSLDAEDGLGGKNSGIKVGDASGEVPVAPDAVADNEADGQRFELDVSDWDQKPQRVNLAGEFNGWNKDALAMHRTGDLFWVRVPLDEGVVHYKFVVDGERWLQDPKADPSLNNDDGNGGQNSGVLVGPDARQLPPPPANAINADAVLFHPKQVSDLNVVSDSQLRLRVRLQDGDAEHVYALIGASPDLAGAQQVELHKLGVQFGFASFGGVVTLPPEQAGKTLHLGFRLTDGSADVVWRGKQGQGLSVAMEPSFVTPAWAQHAVWYQIFPERFRNGDPSNDPNTHADENLVPWTSKWSDTLPGEAPGEENFFGGKGNVWKRRYGGDIQGLRQELPYLRKLGVTAIYLNPVFEAESMHKYDTSDYRHIDDNFGVKGDNPLAYRRNPEDDPAKVPTTQSMPLAGETDDPSTWQWSPSDKLFLDFVAEAHRQGFKVVLDGVFNHVGRAHPFFQDVLAHGKESKYADWFEITDWGDPANWHPMDDPMAVHGKPGGIQWRAWDGDNGHLPVLKKDPQTGLARGPYEHVMAITRRWLAPDGDPSRGIDGWRLDVANDIPHPFWVEWRKVVKQAKPDAYIAGEIWSEAQPWLKGDEFDGVMNYQFAVAVQNFFVDQAKAISPSAFNERLVHLCYMYPFQAALAQMNLFDSHDTDRAASMYVNPDRQYDGSNRVQDNGPNYSDRKPTAQEWTRFRQAVALQMSFVGAPMIYYGDEAGMWSADDPSNRQPMVWPDLMPFADPEVKFDQDLFDFYRRAIAARQQLPALQTGGYFPVKIVDGEGVLVFARRKGEQTVYVAINRSAEPRDVTFDVDPPDAGKSFINYLDPQQAELIDPADGATSRSRLQIREQVVPLMAQGATIRLSLPPFGTAILAEK